MKRVPHPPYSLDLAPCDFYLFGYIKGRLAGASLEEPDQPLQAIDGIFQSIEKPHWNACFRSGWTDWWFRRKYAEKSEDDPSFTRPVSRC
jgi:hypothetical protein